MASERDLSALDYLIKRSDSVDQVADPTTQSAAAPSTAAMPPAAQTAIHAAVAGQVLATAAAIDDENGPATSGVLLSEVDSRLHLGAELLVPVARLLATTGLIEVTETRAFSDDRVAVTTAGREMLAPGQQVELLRRLGIAQ